MVEYNAQEWQHAHQNGKSIAFERVTPELAEQYLGTQVANRPRNQSKVIDLAEAMKRGEWREIHQGIAFDVDDHLIDGQHRLAAIIFSGISVTVPVTRGLSRDAFDVIDVGMKRTAAQSLTLHGEKNASLLAAALAWKYKADLHKIGDYGCVPSTRQIEALLDQYPVIRESTVARGLLNPKTLLPGSIAVWLHFECSQIDGELATSYFSEWGSGENLVKGETTFSLRGKLLKDMSSQAKVPHHLLAAYVIKGWNAWYTGRKRIIFTYTAGEPFPEIAGKLRSQKAKSS